jgi:sulfur carrier protein
VDAPDSLIPSTAVEPAVHVTVDLAGADSRELELPEDATYDDLLSAVDLHPQRAAVLVDGRPVAGDGPVEHDRVTAVRLIKGG